MGLINLEKGTFSDVYLKTQNFNYQKCDKI